ncbi:MAG TPA: ABC transporter substrate-binding protein [Stellaceae bacterium]|nr:ABC transporter substrate-binding protein [Stellaceae bacterium]
MRALRLAAGAVLVLALAAVPFQRARAGGDAAALITRLGDQTLALLQAKDRPEADRQKKFAALVDQAFDVPKIARFVLGRYWSTASDDQRQQFTAAFERYMVEVYWRRFSDYSGETFKVTGQRADDNGTSVVMTEVARANGQPAAKVEWSVSQEDGGTKIRDVSIEGASQALTYRQEFAAIIERNGGRVVALIDELRQKTNG